MDRDHFAEYMLQECNKAAAARRTILGTLLAVTVAGNATSSSAANGRLELQVIDSDSRQTLPCRVHLRDARGRPRKPPRAPFWHDHFVMDGRAVLQLPLGHYTFEIERGPEYVIRSGHFTIDRFADDNQVVDLKRIVNMADENWYSGDLQIQRPLHELERLMAAEDLKVGHLVTWMNGKSGWTRRSNTDNSLSTFAGPRFGQVFAAKRETRENALMFLGASTKWHAVENSNALRSPRKWAAEQAKPDVMINVAHPASWDLPLWLAQGDIGAICVAGDYLVRSGLPRPSGIGKPFDSISYPGALGEARWCQDIYHHILNCGFRIPPTAGSGSGSSSNPVGYNRCYVYVEGKFSYESWWEGLRAGKVVITNGPLLRPLVDGKPPGHVFEVQPGEVFEVHPTLELATRERISYLQIIKDGKSYYEARLDDYLEKGRLPKIRFDKSGWFLIQAVTDNTETYRFASSGPFYVDFAGSRAVDPASVQFFIDWLEKRASAIRESGGDLWNSYQPIYKEAAEFWQLLAADGGSR